MVQKRRLELKSEVEDNWSRSSCVMVIARRSSRTVFGLLGVRDGFRVRLLGSCCNVQPRRKRGGSGLLNSRRDCGEVV